jgi:hypothetical protein
MMRIRACLLLAAAILCTGGSASLLEHFDEGWEARWVHSHTAKYDGRFKAVKPSEWNDTGIQVRRYAPPWRAQARRAVGSSHRTPLRSPDLAAILAAPEATAARAARALSSNSRT